MTEAESNPELTSAERRSAGAIIVSKVTTRIGDVLTDSKTVLTWLLSLLGSSSAIIAMLVPIRESGSMLPQLFISDFVKRVRQRKWINVVGSVIQALAIAGMGTAALTLSPHAAGWVVLGALVVFALARSLCSISSKDVLGRTVPKGVRGRVGGISSTISGLLSAAAAVALIIYGKEQSSAALATIVLCSSGFWLISAAAFASVREPQPEEAVASKEDTEGIIERLALVKRDPVFRQFIIARTLLIGSAFAPPIFVIFAQKNSGTFASLAWFVIATGIAKTTSSFLWGKLADRSSRLAMVLGGFSAATIGSTAFLIASTFESLSETHWIWPLIFFLFSIAYNGVRQGRRTWVIDIAEGDKRTDYVSAANTIIAVMLLLVGAIGAAVLAYSPLAALALYTTMCAIGGILALSLKKT